MSTSNDHLCGREARLVFQDKLHAAAGLEVDVPPDFSCLLQGGPCGTPFLSYLTDGGDTDTALRCVALGTEAGGLQDVDFETLVLANRDLIKYEALNRTIGFSIGDGDGTSVDAATFFLENTCLASLHDWLAIGNIDAGIDAQAEAERLARATTGERSIAQERSIESETHWPLEQRDARGIANACLQEGGCTELRHEYVGEMDVPKGYGSDLMSTHSMAGSDSTEAGDVVGCRHAGLGPF